MFNPNQVIQKIVAQPTVHATLTLVARVLLAYIFIVAGWGKLAGYSATVGYMEAMGVPGALFQ